MINLINTGEDKICSPMQVNPLVPGHWKHCPLKQGGGRVERRWWVNFQCRGVLLVWMILGQGPIALAVGVDALAVGAGGGLFGYFFSHLSFLFSFSLSLGDGPI